LAYRGQRGCARPAQSREPCQLTCCRSTPRDDAQESSAHSPELCAHGSSSSYPHILGHGDAQYLLATHRRIVLQSAVSARDVNIPAGIGLDQAVQAKSIAALHQNNVSPAQVGFRSGLHVNHLPIANRGSHAGSARLKADSESGSQAVQAEGFELPRLRTVFFWAVLNRPNRIRRLNHGS
jgi:hypothetical protein